MTLPLLHYDTGSDDSALWGLGLGCNGSVDIFVQSATEAAALDTLRTLRDYFERAETFAVRTIVRGPDAVGRSILVNTTGDRAGSIGELDPELTHVT